MEPISTTSALSSRGVAITLISAVVGGVAGWLIADLIVYKIEEKQFMKMVEEATNEYEETLDPGIVVGMGDPEEVVRRRVDYAGTSKKAQLEDLVKPYLSETSPSIVPYEAWMDSSDYERAEIIYYADDVVFADEDGEPILSPQDLFGPNIHLHFGEQSQDDDTVYVINPTEETLYQIIRVPESYAVKVLGQVPEEKPKRAAPKRHARRAAKAVKEEKEKDDGIEPDLE